MPTSKSRSKEYKALKKYKESVKKRLSEFIPILQRISMGDYSGGIKAPKKEDEFSELAAAMNITFNELRILEEEKQAAERAKEVAEAEKIHILSRTKKELEKKVKERTKELQERIDELEKFHKLTVGRELKMVELKEEVERLNKELEKYKN
jgi:C4-dicarboxylate-specific signal transduction histidine kinase